MIFIGQAGRIAEFESGRTCVAYVYGRRAESVRWLANASLNGVALDQDLALNEDPFRVLATGERPDPARPVLSFCPVSGRAALAEEDRGQPITERTPALEAFGQIVQAAHQIDRGIMAVEQGCRRNDADGMC